jgi:uncharacterized protein (TIRG00374 family)
VKNNPYKYNIMRVLLGIGLLGIVFYMVDFDEILDLMKNLTLVSIVALIAVSALLNVISSFKWKIFLTAFNLNFPLFKLFNFYIIGKFLNNFLPSNIGGDAYRFLLTATEKHTRHQSFTALFMERFTGFIVLIGFGFVSLIISIKYYDINIDLTFILPILFIFVMLIVIVFSINPDRVTNTSFTNRYLIKLQNTISKIIINIQLFKSHKGILAYSFLLSFLFYCFTIINVYVAAWALNIPVRFSALIVFVPVILIIANIPISINGIGVMEGAYVLCLTYAGVSPSAALSIALLLRVKNLFLNGILGGSLFMIYKRDEKILI